MLEQIVINGSWWLPEKPELRFSGQLKYIPFGNISLELFRTSLDEIVQTIKNPNPEVILGVSSSGELISLFNCENITTDYLIHNNIPIIFTVGLMVKGFHFNSGNKIQLSSMRINYLHLDDWLLKPGFQIDQQDNQITIRHIEPEIIELSTQVFNLRIVPSKMELEFHNGISISSESVIFLKSMSGERPYLEFLSVLQDFHLFLSLAVNSPIYPTKIICWSELAFIEESPKSKKNIDIELFYDSGIENAYFQEIPISNMLFNIWDLRENFAIKLRKWQEIQQIYEPVFRLFFSIHYNPNIYAEAIFLTFTQILESYHRRKFPGIYQDEEGFYQTREHMIEAIPEKLHGDFKASLKARLKYANQYSQRKRLLELFDYLIGRNLLDSSKRSEIKIFIDEVFNRRNWLIHYSPELEGSSYNPNELKWFSMRLYALIVVLFLIELEFDSDLILEKIAKNPILNVLTDLSLP